MLKSLRNFFTIRQVIDLYHPLALRLFLIGTHYLSPINYSNAQLETASDRLYYIFQSLHDCEEIFRQNTEIVKEILRILLLLKTLWIALLDFIECLRTQCQMTCTHL